MLDDRVVLSQKEWYWVRLTKIPGVLSKLFDDRVVLIQKETPKCCVWYTGMKIDKNGMNSAMEFGM